jgi:hypothetical protein
MDHQDAVSSPASPQWFSAKLTELGAKQTTAVMKWQAEMFDVLQGWNRQCFQRAQSEAELASETAGKLMSARSLPETATAYREWLTRRIGMLGKDSERFFAETQKMFQTNGREFARSGSNRIMLSTGNFCH